MPNITYHKCESVALLFITPKLIANFNQPLCIPVLTFKVGVFYVDKSVDNLWITFCVPTPPLKEPEIQGMTTHSQSVIEPPTPSLQQNIDAYCAQLDALLPAHLGKYVVFAHAHLFKVCDSLQSAMTVGYANFDADSFLVQRVEPLRSHIDFQATCQV